MGDPATPDAPTTPPAAPAAPATPVAPPSDPTPAAPTTPAAPATPDDGKGGKDAILADLAKERDKRQELEQKVNDLTSGFAKALGLQADETPPDPAQLTAQINDATAARQDAERQLAIFKAAPGLDANAITLLDSASFLFAIKGVDPTDSAALNDAITKAVEANPAVFKAAPVTPPTPPFNGGPRTPAAPQRAGTLGDAIAQKVAAGNNR